MYTFKYIQVTTIKRKKIHEFERDRGGVCEGGLEGRKGREEGM